MWRFSSNQILNIIQSCCQLHLSATFTDFQLVEMTISNWNNLKRQTQVIFTGSFSKLNPKWHFWCLVSSQNHSAPSWQASLALPLLLFSSAVNVMLSQTWNLSPFLLANCLQFTNIPGFLCCNSLLQIAQRFSVGFKSVKAIVESSGLLLKPSIGGRWSAPGISVLLEGQTTPRRRPPHRQTDVSSKDSLVRDWIHLGL